jgi:hypothetical protein
MSYLYGLEKLIQKHQLVAQEGRKVMTPNAENLFEVVHKTELLNKEKELFIREHLFKDRGGFEFNKKKGLPDIKAYNKHLPSVLREGNETGNQIDDENEIGEIASDITDVVSYSVPDEEKGDFEKGKEKIKKDIKSGLRGKSTAEREEMIESMSKSSSGKGVPIFSYSKKESLKDIVENAPIRQPDFEEGSGNPSEDDEKRDDSDINPFEAETGEQYKERLEKEKEKKKISLTDNQKSKIREIVGSDEYKEDTKQKKAISILVLDKDGNIIANAPSKREVKQLKDDGVIKQVKKVKISNYGVFLELDDGNVAVSVPKTYYNKLFPKKKENEIEKKVKIKKEKKNISTQTEPETPPTTLKRSISASKTIKQN